MDEQRIAEMELADLVSGENIRAIYAEAPNLREMLKTAYFARLEELQASMELRKQIVKMFKAFDDADKQLAAQYSREYAARNAEIPLALDGHGHALPTIDNFLRILEHDKRFAGLKFNELTYSPEQVRNGATERWTDADDAETRHYIEAKYGGLHSVQKCDDALRIVFARNTYHPIRDIVVALKWDGTPRITEFLHRWTECEDTPYTREVSRLIFAGGIHRLFDAGCKFDDMAVLVGTRQGEGKSTLIRWLALEDRFFAEVNEFDGQRGIEAVEGAWICEVSEMLALTKAREQEAVKSYLTRQNDRYRMPFDKRVTDHPRQCIFIGTTNKEQFLMDGTGNRRFYPVKVNRTGYDLFDHEAECKEYIRQCWAEAYTLFLQGKIAPYADRRLIAEIRQKQAEAVEDDYRVGMIQTYLDGKTETCVFDLWKNALGNDFSKPTKKDSTEIGVIMQTMNGWTKQATPKRFAEFGMQRWWQKDGAAWLDEADRDGVLPI